MGLGMKADLTVVLFHDRLGDVKAQTAAALAAVSELSAWANFWKMRFRNSSGMPEPCYKLTE